MKVKVKKDGLLIPKRLLKGITEAEVKVEKHKIIVLPCYEKKRRITIKDRLLKIFNESNGVLPVRYKFNRDEAHDR